MRRLHGPNEDNERPSHRGRHSERSRETDDEPGSVPARKRALHARTAGVDERLFGGFVFERQHQRDRAAGATVGGESTAAAADRLRLADGLGAGLCQATGQGGGQPGIFSGREGIERRRPGGTGDARALRRDHQHLGRRRSARQRGDLLEPPWRRDRTPVGEPCLRRAGLGRPQLRRLLRGREEVRRTLGGPRGETARAPR